MAGSMFTGDASVDFLFHSLFKAGFANKPTAQSIDDGLKLINLFITAACRCVPPANKPTREEMELCKPYLEKEMELIQPRIIVALGRIAFEQILPLFPAQTEKMKFIHGAIYRLGGEIKLVCSYHPSRQNTQTGRLTKDMFDQIWFDVKNLVK
jgi:uracil-DNA glycosylase family 4